MPPGCGWICGTFCAATARGRLIRAAALSACLRPPGAETSISSPPIVHSSATPPARPKNDRRVLCAVPRMIGAESSTHVLAPQVRTYRYCLAAMPATRAEASQRVRDAIVEATVRIVAREGVAAVTHRRVATEAGVSLSSTTWHYATKADILEAALHVDRRARGRRGSRRSPTGSAASTCTAWADELADWLLEQLGAEREATVALYRLQAELLGLTGRAGRAPRVGPRAARARRPRARRGRREVDVRLVIAALDGLRMTALASGEVGRGSAARGSASAARSAAGLRVPRGQRPSRGKGAAAPPSSARTSALGLRVAGTIALPAYRQLRSDTTWSGCGCFGVLRARPTALDHDRAPNKGGAAIYYRYAIANCCTPLPSVFVSTRSAQRGRRPRTPHGCVRP